MKDFLIVFHFDNPDLTKYPMRIRKCITIGAWNIIDMTH